MVGFDIGGTKCAVCVGVYENGEMKILQKRRIETDFSVSPYEMIDRMCALAEEMTDEQRSKTWWHQQSHGGGVYLDICCYGCWFSEWLMGKGAKGVLSMGMNLNTPFGDTADNFGALVRYEDKMSVLEGTWTTPRAMIPSGPMVLCTEGVITCVGGAEDAPDVKAYDIFGNELELPEATLGESMKNMPFHYAAHVQGAPLAEMLTLERNMDVMAMLDATMKSAASGKEESIGG